MSDLRAALGGVTEIRIHGVGGTPPEALLGDPHPLQVSGDRVAGFYRGQDRAGRHVEAYSWGGLTSRSGTRVLWLLLLPFMLANMAGWMARPPTEGATRLTPPYLCFARWAALAVTINIILVNSVCALDVVAYQCGGTACAANWFFLAPFQWPLVAGYPGRRLVLGALLPLALISVFALLSYRSRRDYERVDPPWKDGDQRPQAPDRTAAALDDGLRHEQFWHGFEAHARLSRYHLSVAFAILAMLVTLCAESVTRAHSSVAAWPWLFWMVMIVGWVIIAIAVVLLAIDHSVLLRPSLWLLVSTFGLVVAALLFAAVQPPAPTLAGQLPGMGRSFDTMWIVVVWLLAPLLLWLLAKSLMRGNAPAFRWAAPFVVNGFGLIIANIVMLGVLILVTTFISGNDPVWKIPQAPAEALPGSSTIYLFPMIQTALALLTIGLVLLLLVALTSIALAYWRAGTGKRLKTVTDSVKAEYVAERLPTNPPARTPAAWRVKAAPSADTGAASVSTESEDTSGRWVKSIARWRFIARLAPTVALVISSATFVALALTAITNAVFALTRSTPWEFPRFFLVAGVLLGVAVPPALLALVRRSWKSADKRRIVGILWDVGTFFPRSFHPFAPPSYSERAVPELLRRIWLLHDHGGRVVLAAHSQGSVIAAAALARRSGRSDDEPEITLATFGSPLRKLYQWGFPTFFNADLLDELASGSTGIGQVRWANFYYLTDYIGGPTADPKREGTDVDLRDPPTSLYDFGQPPPRVGSHTGYWADEEMWTKIDRLPVCRGIW